MCLHCDNWVAVTATASLPESAPRLGANDSIKVHLLAVSGRVRNEVGWDAAFAVVMGARKRTVPSNQAKDICISTE